MMRVHSALLGVALVAAAPAFAQAPVQQPAVSSEQAARNAANWDVFLKLYPPRALAAHEEGAVGFTVTLDSKGAVTNCQVTSSSGYPLLDEETCKLITLNAQFKPDPSLAPSQTKTSEGVIAWKLPNSTAPLPAPQAVAVNNAPEKVVCKKVAKIGSLASFERTCMTPTEWSRQRDQMKEMWEDMQGKKGSSHGG